MTGSFCILFQFIFWLIILLISTTQPEVLTALLKEQGINKILRDPQRLDYITFLCQRSWIEIDQEKTNKITNTERKDNDDDDDDDDKQ